MQIIPQGLTYLDNFTSCHTEIQVADQTSHLTQSHYTDTEPTSPNGDPIAPGKVADRLPDFNYII